MQLRKALALGAVAALTAGLLVLIPTAANAAPVAYIAVNGSTNASSVPIDGSFRSGSATFAGSTYGCTTGTTTGTVARGAVSAAADLSFKTLSVNCSSPVGTATISLNSCTVPVDFAGATATDGVDTAVAPGTAVFGSSTCVKVSAISGACTANVQGTVGATFNETVRAGGWQDLILSNSGTLANQSGCLGLLTGSFTLNNIDFGVRVTSGTTTGIDFRLTAQTPSYYIGVNGITDAGSVPIDGTFDSGNATFGGGTYGCSSGIVAGAVERGDTSLVADLSFEALSVSCNTPVGTATISLNSCAVPVDYAGAGASITDGVDTAVAPGTAAFGASACVKISALGGACTANVQGTVGATFDETVMAVGAVNYQDLILNGSGTVASQSGGCGGALTGSFTLNNINFNVRVTGGTTSGIDFRKTLLSSPTSGAVAYIGVNGSTTSGSVAIDGVYKSGNATLAGSTYGCSAGTVSGTVARGAVSAAADLSFTTLGLTCDTPVGPATISLGAGCSVPVDFAGATVYDTTIDTGAGPKYFNVPGTGAFGTGTCVKISALSGLCTANVQGTVTAYYDESVRSVGGVSYQELILSGSGTLANQSGCSGALTGSFTLNNIDFRVKVTSGSTSGIDFRVHP